MRTKTSKKVIKQIFVDLDETLIHTFIKAWGDIPTEDATEVKFEDGTSYYTVLREGAHDFLAKLRAIGNVYMLTTATKEYALRMNDKFKLGFSDDIIYAREILYMGVALDLPKGKVYLFDNLAPRDNEKKIWFLRNVGKVKYIQVLTFYDNKTGTMTPDLIEKLIKEMETPVEKNIFIGKSS